MPGIKKPDWERIDDLEREVQSLRVEMAKLWEAHTSLQRRSSDAILAHTRFA
jgi:hypothetical protein